MDVNCRSRLAVTGLVLVVLCSVVTAQTGHSRYDPAEQSGPSRRQHGLIDFTLKRINSADKDYGKCLGEGRALLVKETVRNGHFWSNVVALGLLACLFTIIVCQQQTLNRRETSAAEMFTEYEHALTRSRDEVHEITSKNLALAESVSRLRELVLSSQSNSVDTLDQTTARTARSRTLATENKSRDDSKNGAAKPLGNGSRAVRAVAEPAGQIGLFKTEIELIAKVNSLNQQLTRADDEKKELRRQLSETTRRLQAEEEKNVSLKGG